MKEKSERIIPSRTRCQVLCNSLHDVPENSPGGLTWMFRPPEKQSQSKPLPGIDDIRPVYTDN